MAVSPLDFFREPLYVRGSPLRDTDDAENLAHGGVRKDGVETIERVVQETQQQKGGKRRRKREAHKGSVLQSEASEIFYELNCAGGLYTACRNRCPKIRRRMLVTDA